MGIKQGYLVCYNVAQALGWGLAAVKLVQCFASGCLPKQANDAALDVVQLCQMASFLEVLHAAVGLVPSSPLMAFMQWAGRSHVLMLVLVKVAEVQTSLWGPLMLLAWSLAEIIRYPWYALTTVDACPGWLTWLRYTMFIPLYPLGVVSEMALMIAALPVFKANGWYSISLPNWYNWAFSYPVFLQIVLCAYPFLWWQLFSGLLRQRRRRLTGATAASTSKST